MNGMRRLPCVLLSAVIVVGLASVPVARAALIAHYEFDVDNGGTTPDSASANFATLGAAVSIDTTAGIPKFGTGALDMTHALGSLAPGDGATTSNSFSWPSDARTITFWWRNKGIADTIDGAYVSYGDDSALPPPTGDGVGERMDIKEFGPPNADLRVELQGPGADTTADIDTDLAWHFIAVTVPDNAQFQDIGIFVDGNPADLNTTALTTEVITGTGPMVFGDSIYQRSDNLTNRTPNGYLDEFRLYDEVLTAGQILALYDSNELPSGDIPEPATLSLVLIGAMGVIARRKRQQR